MSNGTVHQQPRWLRDLLRFLPLKSQFVLSGNVRDFQLAEVAPDVVAAQPLTAVLATELRRAGYEHVLLYDPLAGLQLIPRPGQPANNQELFEKLGLQGGGHWDRARRS